MLSPNELKTWLHRSIPQKDKLLLVLASFSQPCSVAEIRERSKEAGFRIPANTNVSAILLKAKGLAIRIPAGWELSDFGKQHLRNLGVTKLSAAAVQVAVDLRSHLAAIKNDTTRAFVEEAIKCHEAELYRSAIVMSWLAAVDVLHREVAANHLTAFNAEAKRVDQKWKVARTADDLGRMGEEDFLNRMAAISALGKNAKEECLKALKLRNGCGHPNSLKVGPNMVASHIEMLLLNVFSKFEV